MTEEEWLGSDKFDTMLEWLRPDEKARKTRLFKCACCRLMWELLVDQRSRAGVEIAERCADGGVDTAEINRACSEANEAAELLRRRRSRRVSRDLAAAHRIAAELARDTTGNTGFHAVGIARWAIEPFALEARSQLALWVHPSEREAAYDAGGRQACDLLSRLVRDIFVNPFRPVSFDPSWRTSTVVALAEGVYADRAFDRLPILADALEDAGCDQPDILTHCRGPGPHARGCWVVDLILGKS